MIEPALEIENALDESLNWVLIASPPPLFLQWHSEIQVKGS